MDTATDLKISAPVGESGATSMPVYADASLSCSLVNQTTAYVKQAGYGSMGQFSQDVLDARLHPAPAGSRLQARQHAVLLAYDALPAWLKGAIAVLLGAAVYVAVSTVVIGTIMGLAYGSINGVIVAERVLAGVGGCIGGAAGVAVATALNGGSQTLLENVGASALGCLVGAVRSQLPGSQVLGGWLGDTLGSILGTSSAVVGAAATADAAAAGVELGPVSTAIANMVNSLHG